LLLAGLKPELIVEIQKNMSASQNAIKFYLNRLRIRTHEYNNLEWRVDIKLASRSIRDIIEPEIMLKFDLKNDDETSSQVLKTDVVNLIHLTTSLEEALNEIKTNYCRRVIRNVV
jgi:hypothetical protein